MFLSCSIGKVKTTGEIYKHKMQVNNTSQPDLSASLTAPSLQDTESVASDVSSTAVPAMPLLEHGGGGGDGDSTSETQQQTTEGQEGEVGEGGAGGGEGEEGGGKERTETEATETGGGEESTSLPQNPEQ